MIVAEQKPLTEIYEMTIPYEKILVVGCGTCTTVCFAGGEKEVAILASALRMKSAKNNKKVEIREAVIERQCEKEWVSGLKDEIEKHDAIICMGCGAGVQLFADLYPSKPVFPALNTKFIGVPETQGIWLEKCLACGECILDKTAGICPIARCSKSLLNGPCGGSVDGKCEVDRESDCAWQLIYDRLNSIGKLSVLETIMPPKDWSKASYGGVRKVVREDLMLHEVGEAK
jgi:ferredoxin